MTIQQWVERAKASGASDLHLEPGLPAAIRVRGSLTTEAEPVDATAIRSAVDGMLRSDDRQILTTQRSVDLSRTIAGVRCRINVFHTSRGLGMAVRLLPGFRASVESLNLHPSVTMFADRPHGLVLVSGPTGSGKSTTISALVDHINRNRAEHIVTIEHPIETFHRPLKSFIRQREVGRDTPSFEQALVDVLREDPDVIVVGEMRRPETMQRVLIAAETGHLVVTTVHSGSCTEALARIIKAFPAEGQSAVCASLADALAGVICQRLVWRPDLGMRVPELEILAANDAVRSSIRNNALHRIGTFIETGGAEGMFSWDRYRRWMQTKERWIRPAQAPPMAAVEEREPADLPAPSAAAAVKHDDGVVDLDQADGSDLEAILREL